MTQTIFANMGFPQSRSDPPLVRNSDPAGSRDAFRRMVTSGARETQNQRVWWATKENPGATYHAIADAAGMDRTATMRRLADLRGRDTVEAGPDELCPCCGHKMQTWRVT